LEPSSAFAGDTPTSIREAQETSQGLTHNDRRRLIADTTAIDRPESAEAVGLKLSTSGRVAI
jgi:hypothetical protein